MKKTAEEKMVEKFQCPGCTVGGPKVCDRFRLKDDGPYGFNCASHSAGAFIMGLGRIALGLPKGFNRYGGSCPPSHRDEAPHEMNLHTMGIRLHKKGSPPPWNHLNVAVWAMVYEGDLFVRTYSPRTNQTFVDVIEGGTLDMAPGAIDVSKFYDEID